MATNGSIESVTIAAQGLDGRIGSHVIISGACPRPISTRLSDRVGELGHRDFALGLAPASGSMSTTRERSPRSRLDRATF